MERLSHKFSGALLERTLLWEITVIACFSSVSLIAPLPKKRDIFGYRTTVFVRIVNSPSLYRDLYSTPNLDGLFICSHPFLQVDVHTNRHPH